MIVIIPIDKASVYEEVAKITAYVGASSVDASGNTLYERVFTTPHNKEMLDGYFVEACGRISLVMKRFLMCVNQTDTGCVIKLDMPSNYIADYNQSVTDNAFRYVVNYIVAQWFMITNQTSAQQYTDAATGQAAELSTKLYVRRAPNRLEL